eukprot:gnl/TRDRNA2_/TRDRNA2_38106_c0_seq1.p1 gnl/TRDRNA2_/TRDRNA2_38106_c0~~gnl/TRDRNA2_/TRDRNA2_38106_c0_seq1.p1  ORF type:complete len:179 (+),score=43.02 gnl/TRDRNA2_/TRDRNA2_38106_c0_seq1:108-644(+)
MVKPRLLASLCLVAVVEGSRVALDGKSDHLVLEHDTQDLQSDQNNTATALAKDMMEKRSELDVVLAKTMPSSEREQSKGKKEICCMCIDPDKNLVKDGEDYGYQEFDIMAQINNMRDCHDECRNKCLKKDEMRPFDFEHGGLAFKGCYDESTLSALAGHFAMMGIHVEKDSDKPGDYC